MGKRDIEQKEVSGHPLFFVPWETLHKPRVRRGRSHYGVAAIRGKHGKGGVGKIGWFCDTYHKDSA